MDNNDLIEGIVNYFVSENKDNSNHVINAKNRDVFNEMVKPLLFCQYAMVYEDSSRRSGIITSIEYDNCRSQRGMIVLNVTSINNVHIDHSMKFKTNNIQSSFSIILTLRMGRYHVLSQTFICFYTSPGWLSTPISKELCDKILKYPTTMVSIPLDKKMIEYNLLNEELKTMMIDFYFKMRSAK